MHTERIYFDHNAGAPLLNEARTMMLDVLSTSGNASSVHHEGRQMRKHVEDTRHLLADRLGCSSSQIVFTSGATEAANQALSPMIRNKGAELHLSKLYVCATEHPCVLAGGRFEPTQIELLPVLASGRIDLDVLEHKLANHDHEAGSFMVAVMLANNETGVIQPIGEISEIVHRHDGLLLVDAVQGLCKFDFSLPELGADCLLVSSHKIGGPQGVGAFVSGKPGLSVAPLLKGGGQENYYRAGTENVAGIAGFGAALSAQSNFAARGEIRRLRDFLQAGIDTISNGKQGVAANPVVFGDTAERLDNTLCFAVPGVSAETALISLDLAGIAVSSGSACSSGKVRRSHVLSAMGVSDDLAAGAIRISIGHGTSEEHVRRFLDAWKDIMGRMARTQSRVAALV